MKILWNKPLQIVKLRVFGLRFANWGIYFGITRKSWQDKMNRNIQAAKEGDGNTYPLY